VVIIASSSSFALSFCSSSSSFELEIQKAKNTRERNSYRDTKIYTSHLGERRARRRGFVLQQFATPGKEKKVQSFVSSVERNARAPVPASPSVAVAFRLLFVRNGQIFIFVSKKKKSSHTSVAVAPRAVSAPAPAVRAPSPIRERFRVREEREDDGREEREERGRFFDRFLVAKHLRCVWKKSEVEESSREEFWRARASMERNVWLTFTQRYACGLFFNFKEKKGCLGGGAIKTRDGTRVCDLTARRRVAYLSLSPSEQKKR
jgi:hypothetical protein